MPYLEKLLKDRLDQNPELAKLSGELNYVYSKVFLSIWSNDRQYATIDQLRSLVDHPEDNEKCWNLTRSLLYSNVMKRKLDSARALAFQEFYRRIGEVYETKKIKQNGDIYKEELELMKEL